MAVSTGQQSQIFAGHPFGGDITVQHSKCSSVTPKDYYEDAVPEEQHRAAQDLKARVS